MPADRLLFEANDVISGVFPNDTTSFCHSIQDVAYCLTQAGKLHILCHLMHSVVPYYDCLLAYYLSEQTAGTHSVHKSLIFDL